MRYLYLDDIKYQCSNCIYDGHRLTCPVLFEGKMSELIKALEDANRIACEEIGGTITDYSFLKVVTSVIRVSENYIMVSLSREGDY